MQCVHILLSQTTHQYNQSYSEWCIPKWQYRRAWRTTVIRRECTAISIPRVAYALHSIAMQGKQMSGN